MLGKGGYHFVARAEGAEERDVERFGAVFREDCSVARIAAEELHKRPAAGIHALGAGDGEFVSAAAGISAHFKRGAD